MELLDGIIVTQTPPGPEHDFAEGVIPMLKFIVRDRNALGPGFSRYRPESVGRFGNKEAADLLWAVEVSVTSREYDLGSKKATYAAVGVPDCWVIDVAQRLLRTFSKPVEGL